MKRDRILVVDDEPGIRESLTGVLEEVEFLTGHMAACADANFLTVTELADTLVRETGMSFRTAHEIVSEAVKEQEARKSHQPEEPNSADGRWLFRLRALPAEGASGSSTARYGRELPSFCPRAGVFGRAVRVSPETPRLPLRSETPAVESGWAGVFSVGVEAGEAAPVSGWA